LNAAILASQDQDKESKLPLLLKMLVWVQEQLSKHAKFPKIDNLVSAKFKVDSTEEDGEHEGENDELPLLSAMEEDEIEVERNVPRGVTNMYMQA